MTRLVVAHSDGDIVDWRYEADDDYEPSADELIADGVDHRNLDRYHVQDGDLVEDPNYDPRSPVECLEDRFDQLQDRTPVQRAKISGGSKQAFRDARDAGDVQTQLDALFEILTGEEP